MYIQIQFFPFLKCVYVFFAPSVYIYARAAKLILEVLAA